MKKKYIILSIIAFLFAGAHMPIRAYVGDACENPIRLTSGYSQQLTKEGSFWYVANTTELPMEITFHPSNQNADAPYLQLDFGCTPGVYDDSILCSLFCKTKPAYTALPYSQSPLKSYDEQGNVIYRVSFGELYRDMLFSAGLQHDIDVYIHATFYCGGKLEMEPDALHNCMDGAKFMKLGDTVQVAEMDKDRYVIVPYIQWQYDSIRYVWKGEKPCIFAVSNVCDFDPTDTEDPHIIDGGPNNPIEPGGQFKVSSALLMRYVSDQKNYPNEAGLYFAKFYSEEPGEMKIERIPAPAPGCSATLMRLGEETMVKGNDVYTVYAMPSSWIKSMQFTSPTPYILKMYVGKTCEFSLEEAIATYQFDRIENGHQLDLMENELQTLWSQKLANENYLYIRFECVDKTSVRPALWAPSDCELNTKRLQKDVKESIAKKSKTVYSLYYPDWKGGDLQLSWDNTQTACTFYIADTCLVPNEDTAPVFYSGKINPHSSFKISQETVDSWESKADPDGYLYIRFYANARSNITLSTTALPEEDPLCIPYDSTLTTTVWDSIRWCGTKYTESGHYQVISPENPETGCNDTIYTLHLKVHYTSRDTIDLAGCDNIVIGEKKYIVSGMYHDTTFLAGGNRHIQTRNITIHPKTYGLIEETACNNYIGPTGVVYTVSGEYEETTTNVAGCDSIVTLRLEILDCHIYDSVYFCEGFNTEHTAEHGDYITTYLPYTYESPAEWDYMEGVELQHDGGKTLMDLHKAEENLYMHYTDSLMPIIAISWSHRPEGKKTYEPITVEDEPQWIEAGSLALRLQFLCGETYSTSYVTDIDNVDADATPVKRIENGRVIILRGGVKYDMLGNVIK